MSRIFSMGIIVAVCVMLITPLLPIVSPLRPATIIDVSMGMLIIILAIWVLVRDMRRARTTLHGVPVSLVAGTRSDVLALIPRITTADLRNWRAHASPETLAQTPTVTDRLPTSVDPHPPRPLPGARITIELIDTDAPVVPPLPSHPMPATATPVMPVATPNPWQRRDGWIQLGIFGATIWLLIRLWGG